MSNLFEKIKNNKLLVDVTDVHIGDLDLSFQNLNILPKCPTTVSGEFLCVGNNLTSLKHCPKVVGGSFSCNNNRLSSLEGSPKVVDGSFFCDCNLLTSLDGCPQVVNGNFGCGDNPKNFTGKEVRERCYVKGYVFTTNYLK